MDYIGHMRSVAVSKLKASLSRYLSTVKAGREIVVTERGRPVARLVPVVSDREREAEILASLRGRAKMLVGEDEFLQPLTRAAGWHLGKRK